ncbi:trypsin-like cysteine/serine peptidase domain-containing protein [Hypomontagnella monticulosa]|nr:trypsin-like cysteine/serine peptidase domain-containing protein [Hypomontagnella monticulosa]
MATTCSNVLRQPSVSVTIRTMNPDSHIVLGEGYDATKVYKLFENRYGASPVIFSNPSIPYALSCLYLRDSPEGAITDTAARIRRKCIEDHTPSGLPPHALAFKLPQKFIEDEALLDENPIELNPATDVQNGGTYSGVVQVRSVFGKRMGHSNIRRGSAVVIDREHIMTVAHNIWHERDGIAKSIQILRDCRADPYEVDSRLVDAGVVNYQWPISFSDEHDFAILHVSEPLHRGIQSMEYKQTPVAGGIHDVKIYGFPFNMFDNHNGEYLGRLCHSQGQVEYHCIDGLLDHNGDTEKGSSGGPVVESSGSVVAIHKGTMRDSRRRPIINIAVLINRHGNDVEKFMQALAVINGTSGSLEIAQSDNFMLEGHEAVCLGWE